MNEDFCPIQGFGDNIEETGLQWFCSPDSWKESEIEDDRERQGGWWRISENKLLLAPPAKKDFWRKTFYQPLLIKDDGPFLYTTIHRDTLPVTIETSFSLAPKAQFDQAGVLIRLDPEHWIKTGIEFVDGSPRLSCVVTNSFSDWSTQNWVEPRLKIRVHILPQHGGSFVVEAAPFGSEKWSFFRIAHMHENMRHDMLDNHPAIKGSYKGESAPPDCLMVGVFAACPIDQAGTVATFDSLSIVQGSNFVHGA